MNEEAVLRDLETFLTPRVKAAEQGEYSPLSVKELFDEVKNEDNH